jgi:hypothetical protein
MEPNKRQGRETFAAATVRFCRVSWGHFNQS